MNMTSPSKSRDLYGRDEPCGIARTAFYDQFDAARERYRKTSVKRTASMEGAPSIRDRMKSFTQQNPEATADLVRHTSLAKKPADETAQRSPDSHVPTSPPQHKTNPSDGEASVSSQQSSSSSSSRFSSSSSEVVIPRRASRRKKNETTSTTKQARTTKPSASPANKTSRNGVEATPDTLKTPSARRNTYSSNTVVKPNEMTLEPNPVSNRHSICVSSPPSNKSRDLYGRDEPCGIARTGFDDQFAAARARYKKTPVKRTPSMEGTVSLRDRMKSFAQQSPEPPAGLINASLVAKPTTKNETPSASIASNNVAFVVQGTAAASSPISMMMASSTTGPPKNEYSDEESVSSEKAATKPPISCRDDDDDDSSCSSCSSFDNSSSSSEDETSRPSLPTFEAKRREPQSQQPKEENTCISTARAKSPKTPNVCRNTCSSGSDAASKSGQTTPSDLDLVSNRHSICTSSPFKSRDLYGRDEPCGIARTAFNDQFAAARGRYKNTAVKRTPSMEGTPSVKDRMKSFTG